MRNTEFLIVCQEQNPKTLKVYARKSTSTGMG